MTKRERLMTALGGGLPDRVPCVPGMIRWIRYHYGGAGPLQQLRAAEEFDLDGLIFYGQYVWQSIGNDYIYTPGGGYAGMATGVYGDLPHVDLEIRVENRPEHVWYRRTFHTPAGDLHDVIQWARPNMGYGDGPNPHRVEPLVKTEADLERLKFLYPEPRKDLTADIPVLMGLVGDRAVLAASDATQAGAWGMEPLGPEGMLLASVEAPELLQDVCRLAQQAHLRNVRAMLEQGINVVYDSWFQCGPSVGWSPQLYRRLFQPLVKESADLAHEFGALYIYQDDGKMTDIIPMAVEAGVDVLSGLQPREVGDVVLADVKATYGHRVALLGGLDPCYTFDLGTPDRVRQAVRQTIADAGAGGGYIVGTGEDPDPKTPAASLHAVSQAVKDFGVYGRDL